MHTHCATPGYKQSLTKGYLQVLHLGLASSTVLSSIGVKLCHSAYLRLAYPALSFLVRDLPSWCAAYSSALRSSSCLFEQRRSCHFEPLHLAVWVPRNRLCLANVEVSWRICGGGGYPYLDQYHLCDMLADGKISGGSPS